MTISRSQSIHLSSMLLWSTLVLLVDLFVFTVIFFMRPLSASAATVDIAQTVTNGFYQDPIMRNNTTVWRNIGQSFFPNANSIKGIKILLTRPAGTNQTDYYLDLYKGSPTVQASYVSLGRATLSHSHSDIVEGIGGDAEANFVFPTAISLTPSAEYFFRLSLLIYGDSGVHSRMAWPTQIDGNLLVWDANNGLDVLSNVDMYFITYKLADSR